MKMPIKYRGRALMGMMELDEKDAFTAAFIEGIKKLGDTAKITLTFSAEYVKKDDKIISMQFISANINYIEVPRHDTKST